MEFGLKRSASVAVATPEATVDTVFIQAAQSKVDLY